MRLISGLDKAAEVIGEELDARAGCAVTVGAFDGLHAGHRALFTATRERARELDLASVILTFEPHPDVFFRGAKGFQCIATHDENLSLLRSVPIDYLVVAEFHAEVARLSARAFAERILAKGLSTRCLVVGENHRFGHNREGDVETARALGEELGFGVVCVPPVQVGGEPVSSTRVRQAISQGDVAEVARMLGRYYNVVGEIVEGERRGRSLGFPTANIVAPGCKILPLSGVYAGRARIDEDAPRPAVVYIGTSPTFEGKPAPIIECHVLDFDAVETRRDLYGRTLDVSLVKRVREDRVFAGPSELVAQIERDAETARAILAEEGDCA